MGLIASFSAWLKAMRGGHQARSHEEAAKRGGTDQYEAERKAKDEAAKAKFKERPAGDGDIKAGPG